MIACARLVLCVSVGVELKHHFLNNMKFLCVCGTSVGASTSGPARKLKLDV